MNAQQQRFMNQANKDNAAAKQASDEYYQQRTIAQQLADDEAYECRVAPHFKTWTWDGYAWTMPL